MKFLEELQSLKEQIKRRVQFDVPEGTKNIVIGGMGGSGIVGKIFQEMYTKMPVYTSDSYDIPDFVGDGTLFIAISYSGNTEETISSLSYAKKKGAKTIGISSGGIIEKEADVFVNVPGGLQPRSAIGYMLMPLLLSFNVVSEKDVDYAYSLLKRIDENNIKDEDIAKKIWETRRIPVIYGIPGYRSVAYRWKTQFNENAKVIAYSNFFPELNHNDTMALRDTYRKNEFFFISISGGKDSRSEKRIDITKEITKTEMVEVVAEGSSQFEKMIGLVHRGDYVTYHLAKLRGVDPTDISSIEELKRRLSKE